MAKKKAEPKKEKPARKRKEKAVVEAPPETPVAETTLPEDQPAPEAPPEPVAVEAAAPPAEQPASIEPAPEESVAEKISDNGASEPEITSDESATDEPAEAVDPDAEPVADAKKPVNLEELARTLEALLFAAEEPLTVREMARAAGSDSATVRKVLPTIKETYDQQRRPWDLTEIAGGYRLVTRAEFFPAIQRLKTQTAQRKLTQPALETLALIAYRQPIGRAEIESVRGVGAGPVVRLLLEKKLIKISGRGTGLGQPLLYGTTEHFLEHFGLKTLQELPKPGEFKGA